MPKLRKGELPKSARHIRRLSKHDVERDVTKIVGENLSAQHTNESLDKDNATGLEYESSKEYLLTQRNDDEQDNSICFIKKINLDSEQVKGDNETKDIPEINRDIFRKL